MFILAFFAISCGTTDSEENKSSYFYVSIDGPSMNGEYRIEEDPELADYEQNFGMALLNTAEEIILSSKSVSIAFNLGHINGYTL